MKEPRFLITRAFARQSDKEDPLAEFRKEFLFPKKGQVRYFCGHSLGLQPKSVKVRMLQELEDWEEQAVEGHWKAKNPWLGYHQSFSKSLSVLTGAYPDEVIAMNSLTANLHFMFASFYRPAGRKIRILTKAWNFSSDRFALESLVKLYGYDPKKVIIEVKPSKKNFNLTTEDITKAIEKNKNTVTLVLFSGVNYYTGQAFDIQAITRAAHRIGAFAGFDLAHAIGNINLQLHEWKVDFAVWCSYKYLNAGPGAVGGAFILQQHGHDKTTPRMAGWWGHELTSRFNLEGSYKPIPGAAGFQVSNAPVMNMVGLSASLELFMKAGWSNISKKRNKLFDYLVFLIESLCTGDPKKGTGIRIITPLGPSEHGSMLSLKVESGKGKELYDTLMQNGYWVDWRNPDVIRIAAVPLYTTYEDVYDLAVQLSRYTVLIP